MKRFHPVACLLGLALLVACFTSALSQGQRVASTVHNLSSSGPGEVRALAEDEVCKFCHIPHNPVAAEPLWGQALSRAQFITPEIRAGKNARMPAPQPDGSSRLCLSCHDGTVALGDVRGQARPIPVSGSQRLQPGQKGFIGTDLTGSHPISFVVPDVEGEAASAGQDMGLKSRQQMAADDAVSLDQQGKMQCTTCHDPHADQFYVAGSVPRFWVKPTVEEVCLTCHVLR